jgi:hypothetical protein
MQKAIMARFVPLLQQHGSMLPQFLALFDIVEPNTSILSTTK